MYRDRYDRYDNDVIRPDLYIPLQCGIQQQILHCSEPKKNTSKCLLSYLLYKTRPILILVLVVMIAIICHTCL